MTTIDKIKLLTACADILESHGTHREKVKALRKWAKDLDCDTPERPRTFGVKTLIRSDDDNVSDHVDACASGWLDSLTNDDLVYLCEDTGANDTTDGLFWHLDGELGDDPWGIHVAARLGRYLSAINETAVRDTVGFSVRLDEEDLHEWVKLNRPKAWEQYQKENA